jgi:hypothetical protein
MRWRCTTWIDADGRRRGNDRSTEPAGRGRGAGIMLSCCEANYPAKECCDDCGSEICSGCRKCVWGRRLCWTCCEEREFSKDAAYEEGIELSEQEEYDAWRVLTEGQNLTRYDVFSAGFNAGTRKTGTSTGAWEEGRDVEAVDVAEQDRATAADIVQYMRPVYQREDYMTAIAAAIAKARAEGAATGTGDAGKISKADVIYTFSKFVRGLRSGDALWFEMDEEVWLLVTDEVTKFYEAVDDIAARPASRPTSEEE